MAVSEMALKLYSTVVDLSGRFDLQLLKIEAHKANFKEYLHDLLH